MPNYPSGALQEYALRTDVFGSGGGTGTGTGLQGPPGPIGATGPTGPQWTPAESLTAPAVVSGGTIATANLTVSRVDPIMAVSGVILEVGTIAGQRIIVLNQSLYTIQFADSAASHVSNGAISVCPPLTCIRLLWDSVTGYWYPAPGATSAAPGTGMGRYDMGVYDLSTYDVSSVGTGTYGASIYGTGTYGPGGGAPATPGTYAYGNYGDGTYGG